MPDSLADIVGTHIAIWNSTDSKERTLAIAATYAEDVVVAEPDTLRHGHLGLAETVDALEPVPDMQIRITGPLQTAQDLTTYPWAFGPEGGPAVVSGRDVITIRDGLITALYVLIDPPQA